MKEPYSIEAIRYSPFLVREYVINAMKETGMRSRDIHIYKKKCELVSYYDILSDSDAIIKSCNEIATSGWFQNND